MLDVETIKMFIAEDPRPFSRLSDLDSRFLVEIKVTEKAEAQELSRQLSGLGLVVEVADGLAKSDGSLDFWVVFGRVAESIGVAEAGVTVIERFLKT